MTPAEDATRKKWGKLNLFSSCKWEKVKYLCPKKLTLKAIKKANILAISAGVYKKLTKINTVQRWTNAAVPPIPKK
ncbi:Uncharacterised protein [Legionella cincinnatiensis]|uniref:Uncharacterized protein n=1 Tax=Legionella cincinnatiensis TaxID=28085 RepID=A0A378INL7_9GAMM|nr:hypothetical protein Lcin_3394 [Legionella cincinnatiensis]STX36402.1 Uncharacterised protein [Legionella cincinnatiensis]